MLYLAQTFVISLLAFTADGDATFQPAARVLINRCYECHNAVDQSGGLDITTREALLKGGENGAAVAPGNADESFLLHRVLDAEMPPPKSGTPRPLTEAESSALQAWITAGAPWPGNHPLDPFETTTENRAGRDFWSLQPIHKPTPPPVTTAATADGEIDAFLLEKLNAKGWTFAPEADRRTLIRRVSIDLVGLNPTYEQITEFVNDTSPVAYERLVDRLLASPHYGERWGRHWLDIVRYADTCGYERDQTKPNAWKYRDWVVAAFNADMPFDQFIVHQVAGDEIPDRSEASLIATGFIRLGTWNDEPNDPQEYKYERLEDMVHATSTAFLAATVKCARCHDHKFDPIRQTDYFRLAGAFWAGPIEPAARELLGGPDPKLVGSDAFAWTDLTATPPPLNLLKKGDPNRPGAVVPPGQLSMLPALDRPVESPTPDAKTSGRRLALARWIVDPANPLPARVWVNRIWQYHFGQPLVRSPDNFGFTGDRPTHPELLDWLAARLQESGWSTKAIHRAIVLSRAYKQASIHPKQAEYERDDAANRLHWRAERQRLDAETLRDALLTASGNLDTSRIGGPGFTPDISPEALEGLSMKDKAWTPSPPAEQRRRAIYQFVKRGLISPLMTTFDAPDTTLPCGQRDVTLVPTQALALMNNAFVHEQSRAVARRILAEHPNAQETECIQIAWRIILGRDIEPDRIPITRAWLVRERVCLDKFSHADGSTREQNRESALARLCHTLLNSNEFLYVD